MYDRQNKRNKAGTPKILMPAPNTSGNRCPEGPLYANNGVTKMAKIKRWKIIRPASRGRVCDRVPPIPKVVTNPDRTRLL